MNGQMSETMNIQKRMSESLQRASEWSCYTEDIEQGYERANETPMPVNIKAAIGQSIHNMAVQFADSQGMSVDEFRGRLAEDTYSTDVASLARFTFPVIAASIPTLAASDVVSIQPIDRETADIYYINFLYDQTKYGFAPGDTVISATGAPPYSKHYTSEYDLYTLGTGDGVTVSFTGTLRYAYVRASTVSVAYTLGTTTYTATDNGSGTIVGTGLSAGTINYTTGAVALTFSGSPAAPTGTIVVTYKYMVEKNASDGMPKIKLQLDKKSVSVEQRWLAALWSVVSAFNLKTIHNVDAEQLLVNAIVGLLNHELDTQIFDYIYDTTVASGAGSISFSSTNPYTGINLQQYYQDLMFTLAEGDSLITAATGAPGANVIIAGFDFCNIIQGLPEQFFKKEAWKAGTYGPHRFGILGNQYLVIRNPGYTDTNFVMLYKGSDYLHSSYVFAPYMPFQQIGPHGFADDMKHRVGIVTSNALTHVNADLGVAGTIS